MRWSASALRGLVNKGWRRRKQRWTNWKAVPKRQTLRLLIRYPVASQLAHYLDFDLHIGSDRCLKGTGFVAVPGWRHCRIFSLLGIPGTIIQLSCCLYLGDLIGGERLG